MKIKYVSVKFCGIAALNLDRLDFGGEFYLSLSAQIFLRDLIGCWTTNPLIAIILIPFILIYFYNYFNRIIYFHLMLVFVEWMKSFTDIPFYSNVKELSNLSCFFKLYPACIFHFFLWLLILIFENLKNYSFLTTNL